jgi:hypothetical protein
LLEHRPCSRTDLVTKTGLASSAIWRMIDELLRGADRAERVLCEHQ